MMIQSQKSLSSNFISLAPAAKWLKIEKTNLLTWEFHHSSSSASAQACTSSIVRLSVIIPIRKHIIVDAVSQAGWIKSGCHHNSIPRQIPFLISRILRNPSNVFPLLLCTNFSYRLIAFPIIYAEVVVRGNTHVSREHAPRVIVYM